MFKVILRGYFDKKLVHENPLVKHVSEEEAIQQAELYNEANEFSCNPWFAEVVSED